MDRVDAIESGVILKTVNGARLVVETNPNGYLLTVYGAPFLGSDGVTVFRAGIDGREIHAFISGLLVLTKAMGSKP